MDTYELKTYYRIRFPQKEYPWPCKHDPNRMVIVTDQDVLTLTEDGTIVRHGAHGCFGIEIPREDLEMITVPIRLETA